MGSNPTTQTMDKLSKVITEARMYRNASGKYEVFIFEEIKESGWSHETYFYCDTEREAKDLLSLYIAR